MKTENENESTDWNDAMLAGALAEVHGERPPDLAAAILARTGHGPRPRSVPAAVARGTRSWAAAALVAVSAGAVFAVAFAMRDDAFSQGPDGRLWPLDPGASWTYRVDREGGEAELVLRAMTMFPFQAAGETEARPTCQLLVEDGGQIGFEYVAADARGLYRFSSWRRPAMPGLDASSAKATRIVALPVGAEAKWEVEEQQWVPVAANVVGAGGAVVKAGAFGGRVGGGGAPGGGAGRNQRTVERRQIELVAPDAKIKVPAGEFKAVHVRIAPAGAEGDRTVEQLWFVPGTGLVRRVVELDGKVVVTSELKSFQAGKPDEDEKAALAKFLQRDAGVTEFGAVKSTEWIEPGQRMRLRARFAVVTFAEKSKAYCVRGGSVKVFDPADSEAWTALIGAEGISGWNDGLLPQTRCTTLGDLASRMRMALKGWKPEGKDEQWSFNAGPQGATLNFVTRAKDGEGATQRVTTVFSVTSGDQVKVEFPE